MQGTNLNSTLTADNFFTPVNGTALQNKIYQYNPLKPSTKLILFLSMATVGISGFVGNFLVLCFLKTKNNAKRFLKTCSFEKNFAVYIKSLAISDVLSSVISVTLLCVELYFDSFQTGWGCKIARYWIILFPSVTMNNLLVISIEKFFSCRRVSQSFSHSTVKKMVLFAWLEGATIVLLPAATYIGVRYNFNETHYTVVCRFDNLYLPFRTMFLGYTIVQYIVPMIAIIRINISLILTVWVVTKRRKAIDVQRDNGIKLRFRAATVRSTCIIIALTFAFIIPYIFYFSQVIYHHLTKAIINFETDYTIRFASSVIVFSNPAVNFVLYVVQMRDFRAFLNKKIVSWFTAGNTNPASVDIQMVNFSTLALTTVD